MSVTIPTTTPIDRALPTVHEPLSRRLSTRLRSASLDARIRSGEPLDRDPALACRAHQLTTHRMRHRVAEGLERAVTAAGLPPKPFISTRIPPRAETAGDARGPILRLAARLCDGAEPIRPQGAALALCLLTDGASPLHAPSAPGALRAAATLAIDACDRRVDVPT